MHFREQLCSWVGWFQSLGRAKCTPAMEGENKHTEKWQATDKVLSDVEDKSITIKCFPSCIS